MMTSFITMKILLKTELKSKGLQKAATMKALKTRCLHSYKL